MTSISLRVTKNKTILRTPLTSFFSAPISAQNMSSATKTKAPPVIATRTSTCLCKSVQIEVTGEDKNAVLCHCDNCRQASGSAFMYNHRFMKSHITVLKGENLLKVYDDKATKSGATLYRHFCGSCGSPLWLSNSAIKGFAAFNIGNLEGEKRQPFMELFKEGKHSWVGEVTGSSKL
ncbi:uncharacterized protein SEPMUDRAFT_151050 [Sphaerulina musiva SO2202]|uniref:CENP-V/GFA domain-containing protein n=1 Tax=Sphaerulina musiva (strain SO2202) TaxID=692275 RepID=M3CZ91_SPHMS|nr:uncharacterized protein SEPMUDRAFT_151050 [Sphaerulina musiva SO2202]EMF09969.1 hypothetical protein SEPMUDRAFT_151050 [Sphaerulina musiva SO2202]